MTQKHTGFTVKKVDTEQQVVKASQIFSGSNKRLGLIVGGSGFIGGALIHYFKTKQGNAFDVLAPNSKRLSIREPEDIRMYLQRYRPDFIINCAIAPLDSGAQLAYEVNYLGSINLAKAALALGVPYIHFSSAAFLSMGDNVTEADHLPLSNSLSYYSRSKLMAEKSLEHLHKTMGLDYTVIRPSVVYGKHDHKIQGFQRLLFAVAAQSMMFLLTRPGVKHSYTGTKEIPYFVHYVLEHREEFSGQAYNFADHEPVELSSLILAIKNYLQLNRPKELYVPYSIAKLGRSGLNFFLRMLKPLGFDGRLPQELMFLDKFYKNQILSVEKLRNSSYGLPNPEVTVFSELPNIIQYYIGRWQNLNLISPLEKDLQIASPGSKEFRDDPQELLQGLHNGYYSYLSDYESLQSPLKEQGKNNPGC
ncbi:MAG: NAD-dependent epimerase/dehydratase family protein [Thermodesulfobacteriota bacterium]